MSAPPRAQVGAGAPMMHRNVVPASLIDANSLMTSNFGGLGFQALNAVAGSQTYSGDSLKIQ